MAVSFVQASTSELIPGSGTFLDFSIGATITSTTKGILFFWIESGGSRDPLTVLYGAAGAQSAVKLQGGIQITGRGYSSLWYVLNPESGTGKRLTITYSSADSPVIVFALYDGVKQVAPEASTSNTSSSSSITTSVTTITDTAWLVAGSTNNWGTATAGANTTMRFGAVRSFSDSNGGKTPPGSYSLSNTLTGSTGWGMGVAVIAPDTVPSNGKPAFLSQYIAQQ